MSGEWIEQTSKGLTLRVVVQPKASKTQIIGPHGAPQRLKIKVAALPSDGEANEELISFLAKKLGIPKRDIALIRGHQSRQKDLLIDGKSIDEVSVILCQN